MRKSLALYTVGGSCKRGGGRKEKRSQPRAPYRCTFALGTTRKSFPGGECRARKGETRAEGHFEGGKKGGGGVPSQFLKVTWPPGGKKEKGKPVVIGPALFDSGGERKKTEGKPGGNITVLPNVHRTRQEHSGVPQVRDKRRREIRQSRQPPHVRGGKREKLKVHLQKGEGRGSPFP